MNDYDEEVQEIAKNQDIDLDEAEIVNELMNDYVLDEDDAVELNEFL